MIMNQQDFVILNFNEDGELQEEYDQRDNEIDIQELEMAQEDIAEQGCDQEVKQFITT